MNKPFTLNIGPEWLLYMVEKEDNCDISVGGSITELINKISMQPLDIHDIVKQTNIKYYSPEFHKLIYRPNMINQFYITVDHPKYNDICVIDHCNYLLISIRNNSYPWKEPISIDLNRPDWIDKINEIFTYNNDADFI